MRRTGGASGLGTARSSHWRSAAAAAALAVGTAVPVLAGAPPEPTASTAERAFAERERAAEGIGTFDLSDGTRIHSTGRRRRPFVPFDPTIEDRGSDVPIIIAPQVYPGRPGGTKRRSR